MSKFKTKLLSIRTTCHQINKTSGFLIISLVIASLSACSNSPNTTTSQSSPTTAPSSEAMKSPITQAVQKAISIPGVSKSKEISFQTPPKGVTVGFFDAVNGSAQPNQTLPKTKPFEVSGWAVSSDKKKPAESVIITIGEANIPVAIASVKNNRPDVVKILKTPSLFKSGWQTSIDPSSLSGEKVMLKAWSYDSKTKKATLLGNKHEIVFQ